MCTLGQKPTFYLEIHKNLMFEKCEFCEKWDFDIVNFVKNETFKMWILDKLRIFAPVWCFHAVMIKRENVWMKINLVQKHFWDMPKL